MKNICISCCSNYTNSLLELGPQPPSNRFLFDRNEIFDTYNINFDICTACGLAQLRNPMPPSVVRSHFDWITYNEPEGHLDHLVELLIKKDVFSPSSLFVGITYKDDTTLDRISKKGFKKTYRLSKLNDLSIKDSLSSLETIQEAFSPILAKKLAAKIGKSDVLLVRHILEHAHNPRIFLDACHILCKQGGLLVFEVPDCSKIIDGHDHFFLWEEHISYFTPETFTLFFKNNGFNELETFVFSYPMENSLIAIVRNDRRLTTIPDSIDIDNELLRWEKFTHSFYERGYQIKKHLQSLRSQGQRIALFGAGHLAAKFINFYDLADNLVGVIDDNPNKIDRLMPGSKLPIIESRGLEDGDIDLCLLTLSPESEQKVRKAKASYLSQGGKFRSIFSASSNSLEKDLGND